MIRTGKAAGILFLVLSLAAAGTVTASAAEYNVRTEKEATGPGRESGTENMPEDDLAERDVLVTEEAQPVNYLNGVAALCRPGGREDFDPLYSCTAFVVRYYHDVYGMPVYNMWQYKIPTDGRAVPFTMTTDPEPGDIGYQTTSEGGPHWFIVKHVNRDGSVVVLEQNWKWMEYGETWCTVNRRVVPGETRDLFFFRRPQDDSEKKSGPAQGH
ncbi:MAG: hypothetical protein K6E83_11220 [Clostridium sp.]|nr:hypothetical protein [Clostridium sp.]